MDDLRSVAHARRYVAERLAAHGLFELAADAEVVVSEVVTNALLHGEPPVDLLVRVSAPRVRIEVYDRSEATPVRLRTGQQSMTGRGLRLVDGLARDWGVEARGGGKSVWVELEVGATPRSTPDADDLIAMWADDEPPRELPGEPTYTVRLGHVPTDLLLTAKSHVDDLAREFALAASGASSGVTAQVPQHLAGLIEAVVHRFADAREAIRRQALTAMREGRDHVTLELHLPASAAQAGQEYLRALDEADAYSRAARLLTLETPPQHRLFRRWYVEELVGQLRRAAEGEEVQPTETFEQRLLREIDRMAEHERRVSRAARLYELAAALAGARTPEAVARAGLEAGATALGASGGAVLLSGTRARLVLRGSIGYDAHVVARLSAQSPDTDLPAATALRTGEAVWLESPADRDERFPELAGLEPGTVSMVALPLTTSNNPLGAMRFSFTRARLFDDDERSFVTAIAAQTAQALERAQLATARTEGARRLQRSLLPPALPSVPGIRISSSYHPLTTWMDLGGDFYDAWQRGDRRLAVTIGDVCGHGPEAAALSALVRHTLRALTLASTDAVAILGQLDDALSDAVRGTDRFATVLFGFLTAVDGECWLDVVTGGHPAPVIVHDDGEADALELQGSLLGIIPDPEIARRRVALRPGDEVVFVTDGVTDARDGQGRWFGPDGMTAAVRAARSSGVETAEAVSQAVLRHTGGSLQDDLAVLSLRWDGD